MWFTGSDCVNEGAPFFFLLHGPFNSNWKPSMAAFEETALGEEQGSARFFNCAGAASGAVLGCAATGSAKMLSRRQPPLKKGTSSSGTLSHYP